MHFRASEQHGIVFCWWCIVSDQDQKNRFYLHNKNVVIIDAIQKDEADKPQEYCCHRKHSGPVQRRRHVGDGAG
jgi:hypothetical protein